VKNEKCTLKELEYGEKTKQKQNKTPRNGRLLANNGSQRLTAKLDA
jgi:hypothetical protein